MRRRIKTYGLIRDIKLSAFFYSLLDTEFQIVKLRVRKSKNIHSSSPQLKLRYMTENIKEILNEYKEETKRHFDIVAEDLKSEIRIVAEQVAANAEKLEEHDQRFNKIDNTLEVIKLDIEFIKNDLKQKVGRDEFAILEKRVSMLEAKSS